MRETQIPFKNITHEVQLTSQRAVVALGVMILFTLLLTCRLAYLQIYKNKLYTTLSINNSMELVPLEPTRGLIFDRHGVLLADNMPVFSLDVIPDKAHSLHKSLSEITKIVPLSEVELTAFQKQLKQHRRFDEIPLKLRLTEAEAAHFAENQHRFPGFVIKGRLIRHYPYEQSFSHALGYIGQINTEELNKVDANNYSASHYIGKLGIEKYYEEELHGKVGYQEVEVDANGEPVRILKYAKPIAGKNLYLSIDSSLQLAAEQALKGRRGAIVALEPATGQVLALASMPSYDPNLFVLGISTADFQKLQKMSDHPLYNRAVRGLYPLASTIKPYLALEALDNNVVSPEDTVYDPGWFILKNSSHVFRDMKTHGHGTVNLTHALATSCDVYFYELAIKLGIKRINNVLHKFGFGEVTGIEMDEEVTGVVPSPEWKQRTKRGPWYEGDTVISGIGQGYIQATPLQLAVGASILASHGKHLVPSLLLGQQEPGRPIELQNPILMDTITLNDDKSWDIIINAMRKVIDSSEGTAHRYGAHPGYTIAAKTGTAQVHAKKKEQKGNEDQSKLVEQLRDHGLFIAFAPVEQPKIALAIIVENDRLAAVPIARQLLDFYLKKRIDKNKKT